MLDGIAIVFETQCGFYWREPTPPRSVHGPFESSSRAILNAQRRGLKARCVAAEFVQRPASVRPTSVRQTFDLSVRERTSMRLSF